MFEHREGRELTNSAYEAIGGTIGALGKRANGLYLGFDTEGQEIIRQMFLRLVTLGEGIEDSRRRVRQDELRHITNNPDLLDEILDIFVRHRLLTLNHDPVTRLPTVEVAHEAILHKWLRLRLWLENSREDIRLQRQLARMAIDWKQANEESSFLLQGAPLDSFIRWKELTDVILTPDEQQFLRISHQVQQRQIEESQAQQNREAQLEQRAHRRLQILVTVLAIATLITFVSTIIAIQEGRIAQAERSEAQLAQESAEREAAFSRSLVLA